MNCRIAAACCSGRGGWRATGESTFFAAYGCVSWSLMWLWIAISNTTRYPLLRGSACHADSISVELVLSNDLDAAPDGL